MIDGFRPFIKNYSPRQLVQEILSHGHSAYRGQQVSRWIYVRGAESFDEMSNLSWSLRQELSEHYCLWSIETWSEKLSSDGSEKYTFHLHDGAVVEGVAIPEENRFTYCLSTQVGCPLQCQFCVTGDLGFRRNLSTAEIVEQLLIMRRKRNSVGGVCNVVLMGMGEPLLNYDAVSTFLEIATDSSGFGLSGRRITLSTVGFADMLDRFSHDWPSIQLAISLNASRQEIRQKLMPVASRFDLYHLVRKLECYPLAPRRRITIEYVLLSGENDADEHAIELARLLRRVRCKINIIPYNENEHFGFQCPTEERIERFCALLRDRHMTIMVRRSRGEDIGAACGQLGRGAGDISKRKNDQN